MSYYGIDYGMGQTNIDNETGIRYGVIPQNAVLQVWADSSEPYYGEDEEDREPQSDDEDYEPEYFDDSEPIGYVCDDEGYEAECGDDGDIFIFKSPYYTNAQFCSPCAPGACHLENPVDSDGPRAYCFAPDWFEWWPEWPEMGVEPAGTYLEIKTSCPYPVYRVSDGECIYRPTGWVEE